MEERGIARWLFPFGHMPQKKELSSSFCNHFNILQIIYSEERPVGIPALFTESDQCLIITFTNARPKPVAAWRPCYRSPGPGQIAFPQVAQPDAFFPGSCEHSLSPCRLSGMLPLPPAYCPCIPVYMDVCSEGGWMESVRLFAHQFSLLFIHLSL